jgi:hypothetical protein
MERRPATPEEQRIQDRLGEHFQKLREKSAASETPLLPLAIAYQEGGKEALRQKFRELYPDKVPPETAPPAK